MKVEKAKIPDVAQMHQLINQFAQSGEMLARPLSELYEDIRDYFVIKDDARVLACGALHVSWEDLAEVRSVAVGKDAQGEAQVELEYEGRLYRGRGVSTDSIEASTKAFLNAINRIAAAKNHRS